jgi:hypothetical protein
MRLITLASDLCTCPGVLLLTDEANVSARRAAEIGFLSLTD